MDNAVDMMNGGRRQPFIDLAGVEQLQVLGVELGERMLAEPRHDMYPNVVPIASIGALADMRLGRREPDVHKVAEALFTIWLRHALFDLVESGCQPLCHLSPCLRIKRFGLTVRQGDTSLPPAVCPFAYQ